MSLLRGKEVSEIYMLKVTVHVHDISIERFNEVEV